MSDEDGHFGERVAAGYDESPGDMFESRTIDEAVRVLAELCDGSRPGRTSCRSM